jgi:orotidine-5'-phosphate decarboxylase
MTDRRANELASGAVAAKAIPPGERLILALDVAEIAAAKVLVERLGPAVCFYKIGLELFMAGGCFEFLDWLAERDKHAFVDLKFFDVPRTVASAVRQLAKRPARFATVHGNDAILEAAVAEKGPLSLLAVTVLTSLDQADMDALGFRASIRAVVLARAKRALAIGCDGIVSSGLEVAGIRAALGPKLVVVVPGIRPGANRPADDQKRTVDVEDAFRAGADYIVVGRPIHGAADPRQAAEAVQARIQRLFGG